MGFIQKVVYNMFAVAVCLILYGIDNNEATSITRGLMNATTQYVRRNETSAPSRFRRNAMTNGGTDQRICIGNEPEYCDGVDISQAAHCPWTYQPNIKMNRKPQLIYEAVCDCSSREGSVFECRRVYRSIYVKVKCRRTGYRYVDSSELIAVACVPVRPCSRSA